MQRPRVTGILQPFTDFSMVPPGVLTAAAERGTLVHHSCASWALNFLPPHEGFIDGYFQSFRVWFDSFVIEVLAVEEEVIHPAWGYVGHVDLIAKISGVKPDPIVAVIDYKTPYVESRSWRCQTAAYLEASKQKYGTEAAGALMLRKDGSFPKMVWIDDHNQAFAAFCGALSAHNYIKGAKC